MRKTILEHYLYCLNVVGVCASAQAISDKFNQFIEERGLDWKKCKSVTTDGAAAMQASPNGCYTKYKNRFPWLCFNSLFDDSLKNTCVEIDRRKQSVVRSGDCSWWCHKNCEFHLLKFNETSNVFRTAQRHGGRRNEITSCWGTMIIQRNIFKASVSTTARVAGFPCSKRTSNVQ